MIVLWGLKNCDTCRKAKKWLDENAVEYEFKDVRAGQLDKVRIEDWIEAVGLEVLVNRRGTTWRKLPDSVKENVSTANAADLLVEYPALMKRPIFEMESAVYVGFGADVQKNLM